MTGTIRAGVGGWTYPPWRGVFYPAGLPQKRELEFLSRAMTTIEINGTFYSAFKPADFARWRDAVPDRFMFSMKASRYCTNRRNLAEAADAIGRFVSQGIAELREKLGPINWQFAATKKFDPGEFEAFLALLPKQAGDLPLRHALEPRHPTFDCKEFVDLARRFGCAITFADSDKYPCIDRSTADFTYARLMRTRDELETGYSDADLEGFVRRARKWAGRGDVFVYFIAGAKLRAPAAATTFLGRL